MNNITITGATGLIGRYITRHLVREGYKVTVVVRNPARLDVLHDVLSEIQWIEANLMNSDELEEAFSHTDCVIHCAALVSYNPLQKEALFKINLEGTKNVVNACLNQNVGKLVYMSSIAALGKNKFDFNIDETTPRDDYVFNSDYAKSKYLAELEVWRGIAEGLPSVILNPSLVLGPGELGKSSTQVFEYVWKESKFYTKGLANYVDVRDIAEATLKVLNPDISNEKYILNGGNVSYKQLFNSIAEAVNKKPPYKNISAEALKFVGTINEWMAKIFRIEPLISASVSNAASNKFVYDSAKAENQLSMQFSSLQDSVSWVCKELFNSDIKTVSKVHITQ